MNDLPYLQTGQIPRDAFEHDCQAGLVEYDAEHESPHHGLEHSDVVPFQVLQVEVSVQVLMHQSVPFPGVFLKVGRVPEVLVELSVRKTRQFSVEVGEKVEYQEKT